MWYSIVSEDVKNSLDLRLKARPAHLERLIALKEKGRLLVAGPQPSIDNQDPAKQASVVASLLRNLTTYRMLNIGRIMTPTLLLAFTIL